MRFFVPPTTDPAVAEQAYDGIRSFARESMGWDVLDRRIYEIKFRDRSGVLTARVGEVLDLRGERGLVVAILQSNTYLICTPERGVMRGIPIMVGANEVEGVTDFEAEA